MSVITFGTSFVGKVDRVEGKCYVVTKAFQIVNLPLVPLGGYLVEEGTEKQTFVSGLQTFSGKSIELSWKSFAWGIARAVMFGGGLLAVIGVVPILLGAGAIAGLVLGPVLGAALLYAWWRTRRGLRASPARAKELEHLLAAERLPRALARFDRHV